MKKTAEQEEHGHSEPVDGGQQETVGVGLRIYGASPGIFNGPGIGDQKQGGVQDDAEQHGGGPEGVQMVVSGGRLTAGSWGVGGGSGQRVVFGWYG